MRSIAFSFIATFALMLTACDNSTSPNGAPGSNGAPGPNGASSSNTPVGADARPIDVEASTISFVGTKDSGKHDGGFKVFAGTIAFDAGQPETAGIVLEIDVDSMWSDNEKLTAHLKSPDFFEVNSHPKANFKSTKIEPAQEGYQITGDLTIKGKTNTITMPATISTADGKVAVKTAFDINRFDYDIEYDRAKVHETVKIDVELVAVGE